MAGITSENAALAIVKIVANRVIPRLLGALVMGNLVNRDYESDVARSGDTVSIPIAPTMVANNIAEGGQVQTQNPNMGSATITLDTHVESSFTIPDVTKMLVQPDLVFEYAQSAIDAIAERIETDLLALYSSLTYHTPLGAAGQNISESLIDTAETTLFNTKVPANLQRFCVLTGNQYAVLRQIPRFSEAQTIETQGVKAIVNGVVGRLKDILFLRSQYVTTTAGPTTAHNLVFTRNAIGMAMRRLPGIMPGTGAIAEYAELGGFGMRVVMSYNPATLSQQVTIDTLYGKDVMDGRHGLELTTG